MRSEPTPLPGIFQQACHSSLAEFDGLVRALTEWADRAGVTERSLRDIVLILDELFSNIVIHGYQHDPAGNILVEGQMLDGQVHVTLTDHAPAFNPLRVPEPDTALPLEARPIGGLGLLFVRRTADSLHYRRMAPGTQEATNQLRFTKWAGTAGHHNG